MTIAYCQGAEAELQGKLLVECPYAIGTLSREQWIDGWLEAAGTVVVLG